MTTPASETSPSQRLQQHFQRLAEEGKADRYEDRVLWPNTPIRDIQPQIKEFQGVDDWQTKDPRSRPYLVCRGIESLRQEGLLEKNATVLDVPCGDGLVLGEIQRRWKDFSCFGLDSNVFQTYVKLRKLGCRFYPVYLQRLFAEPLPQKVDVVMMLNTFRGWHSAQLRPHEQSLEQQATIWLLENARHLVLTVREEQLGAFDIGRMDIDFIGPGEEGSQMVLISPY